MEERIKVVLVEPGKDPEIVEIDQTLKTLQKLVGGYIQVVYPWDDSAVLICNEEGKMIGLTPNRYVKGDVIFGTFIVAGAGRDMFESLTEEQICKYTEMLRR